MNVDHLRLFRDLAQHRSVSRAAELNEVSQSAASQSVQELERSLGVKLLDRSRRPLALTEAGRLYHEFCRDVLRRKEELDVALEAVRQRAAGAVRVACIYSVGLTEMTGMKRDFSRRLPEAELHVEYLRPERVYETVLADAADLGLVSYPEARKGIQVIPWRQEQMVVAMAPSHPLAVWPVLAPRQLQAERFVGFDEDLPISREVRRFLREAGVEVEMIMHFDNIAAMKEAVAIGSGISILPDRILRQDVEQGRIAAIPLEAPGLYRPLGIIHRRKKVLSHAARAFLELLRERREEVRPPPTSAVVEPTRVQPS